MSIIVELQFFCCCFRRCCSYSFTLLQESYFSNKLFEYFFFVEVWKKFYLHINHPDEKKMKQSTIEIMWLLKVANLLRRC